jgi:type I restriction enzyme M protein
MVSCDDIASQKYDLSINHYKELVYEEEKYDPPKDILGRMKKLECDILADLEELEEMLG